MSDDADFAALRDYAKQVGPARAGHENLPPGHPPLAQLNDPDVVALRDYVRQIGPNQSAPAEPRFQMAEADNAFDALREFLRGNEKPAPAPDRAPDAAPRTAPRPAAPRVAPVQPRPAAPRVVEAVIDSHYLPTETCLLCHSNQADSFSKTLMGRIGKTHKAKLECQNCHGPASAHVKAGGCAACHGDTVSRIAGMPTLAGQQPEYLVPAMKNYMSGKRRNDLMRDMLSGVSDAELQGIAHYYSRLTPLRAQTPAPGDPAAGRAASALCQNCHGEQGKAVYAGWPNLAGQDALYLSIAIKAYKDGSRSKVVACAGCHGEGGVSKTAGMPSLAGLDPEYLVPAMKAYTGGQRKHGLMKAMLAGLSDAELDKIAKYYAGRTPGRAQTPSIGNATAGKAAAESCAGCHGEQGVSPSPEFPSLAGQDAKYLATAIRDYKNGSRDNEMMKPMAEAVEDSAINDIAAYYASLPPKPAPEKNTAGQPEPSVVKNVFMTSLDERTANNIVAYFASQTPSSRNGPAVQMPALVAKAVLTGGRSLGGIISYRKNDPGRRVEDNNGICLGCHEKGGRNYWSGSTHESRAVACTECHTVMRSVSRKANLKTEFEPETCFQCHKDRRAQFFRSSHMPMREGKMVCSSCHNPHGSATDAMLIESSINATCYKCHAEKRGPFLFEHTPVRENCANCHDPHGSVNENLLKVSRPRLCGECHTIDHGNLIAGGPKTQYGFSRSCQNCHSKVHGTNHPSGALLQR